MDLNPWDFGFAWLRVPPLPLLRSRRLNGSEDGLGRADEVLQGAVALGSEDQPMA